MYCYTYLYCIGFDIPVFRIGSGLNRGGGGVVVIYCQIEVFGLRQFWRNFACCVYLENASQCFSNIGKIKKFDKKIVDN